MTLTTLKQRFLKKYHNFFPNPIPQYPTLIKYFHLYRTKNNYKPDSQSILNRFDKKARVCIGFSFIIIHLS